MDEVSQHDRPAPQLHCVHEVRVEIPAERRAEVLHFYTALLGLPAWPDSQQIPGGVGLGDPRCGLYLQYRHDAQVDPMRRRLTLVVGSLDALVERLAEHRWRFVRGRGFGYTDQWLLMGDPVGHIIEVRQQQDLL